jgi:hypothetical protein
MSSKEASKSNLIEVLANGWDPSYYRLVQELVMRWKNKFNTNTEIKYIGENELHFVTDLSDIRLRGMGEVECLLIGGDNPSIAHAVQKFWKEEKIPGRLPFVLTLSKLAYEQVQAVLPHERCLVLSAEQVQELLNATEPRQFLKRYIWQQIPKHRLIPYTILLPVEGAMFFGRHNDLDRLRNQEDVSFAIAGPSRIGKTSLVKQYKREMSREDNPQNPCRFYINLYDCKDKTPDGVARHIAMEVGPSSRSDKVTSDSLVHFLRYKRAMLDRPLDLLVDEVDEVCQGETFKALGAAARQGFCRLVLCGRGVLLKMALSTQSPLGCRLELIRLEPLDDKSARNLLLEPLADLGFSVDNPDRLVEHVFRLTGKLPHLLQFYGMKLANLATEEKTDTISMMHVDTLRWDFETAQYFTSPLLQDLADTETRLIALLLLKSGEQELKISLVRDIAAQQGLYLDHARTVDICNDLVINNVLAWHNGSFRIANEALAYYAHEMGYLDGALEEARRVAKSHS